MISRTSKLTHSAYTIAKNGTNWEIKEATDSNPVGLAIVQFGGPFHSPFHKKNNRAAASLINSKELVNVFNPNSGLEDMPTISHKQHFRD